MSIFAKERGDQDGTGIRGFQMVMSVATLLVSESYVSEPTGQKG